ncbi:organic cation transporter 1 isoform X1 [Penaeus vannamei]|uniref:organic cation transporter 1 isoform X1 n=1 Tax=Penaeus vannamei TaxID=6689 RepID=UPI000F67E117|nr:organic cation transporter 1-like isoform X1 [Penaeus vannamei]
MGFPSPVCDHEDMKLKISVDPEAADAAPEKRASSDAPQSPFERVLDEVGGEGRYQILLLFAYLLPLSFYSPFGSSSLLLMMTTPDHSCRVPGRPSHVSEEEWRNMTIPWEDGADGKLRLSQCHMYNMTYSDALRPGPSYAIDTSAITRCQHGWDYDKSRWRETSVSFFNLVCDDASSVTTIFSLAVAGNALGTLILSILSDRIGRRPVFFLTVLINFSFGLLNMLVPTKELFAAARFLTCLAFFSFYQMSYIIVVELSSGHLRGLTAALSFVVGTVGVCCVTFVAWVLAHWRSFGIACHAPSIFFFLYWWYLPESPRWLLSMGRVEECVAIMKKVAATNGRALPSNLRELLEEAKADEKKTASMRDLLRHSSLRKHLVITSICIVIFCVVHSGIMLNLHNMAGSELVNFLVLSVVEVPGNVVGGVSAHYFGRRLTLGLTLTVTAVFAGLATTAITDRWLLVTFCGLAKVFVTAAVLVVYMQIGELFPTALRSLSYGTTSVAGLSATVFVPALVSVGATDRKLPYYILCGLCIFGAAVSTLLPETLGRPLPQTVLQANHIGQDESFWSITTHWTRRKYVPIGEATGKEARNGTPSVAAETGI